MSTRAFFVLAAVFAAVACGRLGALKNERFACNTSGDCADGYTCVGGECALPGTDAGGGGGGDDAGEDAGTGGDDGGAMDAGPVDAGPTNSRDAGVACSNTNQCLAGLTCVDGVCCTTTCNAPCDSCNQVDNLGTCLPRPPGAAVIACGLYTCNGTDITCPTTCDVDAGLNACAPAGRCEDTTCVPCWSGTTDTFSGTAGAWSFSPSPATLDAEAVLDGGQLVLFVRTRPGMDQYASATSAQASGLRNCGVTFEMTAPPSVDRGYVARAQLFRDAAGQRPSYGWSIDVRGLVATWALSDGGSGSSIVVPDGGALPRWLQVQESGGTVQWRTTSGSSFTTVHSVPHDGNLDALKLRFDATYPAQGGNVSTTWAVDNLNRGP